MLELADLEHRLDDLTAPLLVPLRSDKIVDSVVMADLLALGDKLADELRGMDQVPRSLVGKSYFIFTQMLTESEHASAPDPSSPRRGNGKNACGERLGRTSSDE